MKALLEAAAAEVERLRLGMARVRLAVAQAPRETLFYSVWEAPAAPEART